jgi:hypothetical protein
VTTQLSESSQQVFRARERLGLQAALCLAGGIGVLLVMIVIFLLDLSVPQRGGNDFLPGILGGTSIIWIALIARGLFLLRSVTQVAIDPDGVHLQGFISRKTIAWSEIDRIQLDKRTGIFAMYGGKSHNILSILDARGKTLGTIPDTIENFGVLGEEIAARSSDQTGHTTYNASTEEQRQIAKSGRKMKFAAVLAGIMALFMGAAFVWGLIDQIHVSRYATEGVTIDAKVVDHYMLRVTPYVKYAFKDEAGKLHTREAMMKKGDWDLLALSRTVPVQYLRSDPEWNRLVHGEDETSLSGPFLWISGGMTLLMGFFCVTSILGYDLKSEGGVTRLVRHGQTLKQWGTARAKVQSPQMQMGAQRATFGLSDAGTVAAKDVVLLQDLQSTEQEVPLPPPSPSMQQRKPAGLMALAIFCIIFGALGMGINLLRLVLIRHRPELSIGYGIDALLAVALLVVGGGLLARQLWSRSLGIVVAILQILSSAAGLAYLIVTSLQAPELPGQDQMMRTAAEIGGAVGLVIGAIFPIILLIILSKRSTKAALVGFVPSPGTPREG